MKAILISILIKAGTEFLLSLLENLTEELRDRPETIVDADDASKAAKAKRVFQANEAINKARKH